MATLYLLDMNTVSYIIKGRPPRVRQRLLSIPAEQIATSVITEAELRFGVAKKPEATNIKMAIEEFLRRVAILPWDSEAAHHYAELRATLERTGRPIANLDLMIAAHALAAGATLVTNDTSLRRLRQVRTQDWTRA
jgi:tRNA(fMet)-specific endonuclease VapC